MTKEERLAERERLSEENVRWKDKNFLEHVEKFLATYTPEELLEELIECGLEVNKNDEKEE